MKKSTGWMIGTIFLIICFILQLIGTIRYLIRMNNDFIGIIIYVSALVFFGIAAIGFYLNWVK